MLTVYLVINGVQVFVYTEFLALAIAKVWAGKADLPGTSELWRQYDETVKYHDDNTVCFLSFVTIHLL